MARSGQIIWDLYNEEPYDDDIIMLSDGVLAEIPTLYIKNIFGKDVFTIINDNKNQLIQVFTHILGKTR